MVEKILLAGQPPDRSDPRYHPLRFGRGYGAALAGSLCDRALRHAAFVGLGVR